MKGRAQFDPKEGAPIYAKICQKWGEDHLKGFDGIERLGELAERVVNNASPLGAPLFVGWRDQTLPEPGAGRTMQLCQTSENLVFSVLLSNARLRPVTTRRDYEWANGSVERRDVRLEGTISRWRTQSGSAPRDRSSRQHTSCTRF